MKLLAPTLTFVLVFGVPLFSRDFKETERIINTILSEEKADGPSVKDKKSEPVEKDQTMVDSDSSQDSRIPEKEKSEKKQKETLGMSQPDEVLLKTGIQFFNSGLYAFSLKQFSELASKYPQSQFKDGASMYSGKIYLKQNQYDKALEEFSSIQDKSGEYPNALFYAAETYSLKGMPEVSIEHYTKMSAMFPDHELADDALLKIGRLYLNRQKGLQALDATLSLIKYYRTRETVDDAYYLLGTIFMKDPELKDFEKARKTFILFMKMAENGEPQFSKSPLRFRVKSDLMRIEKTYYKLEK